MLLEDGAVSTHQIWSRVAIMIASHLQELRGCHIFHRSLHHLELRDPNLLMMILLLMCDGCSRHVQEFLNWGRFKEVHRWRILFGRDRLLYHGCKSRFLTQFYCLSIEEVRSVWHLGVASHTVHDVLIRIWNNLIAIWNTTLILCRSSWFINIWSELLRI